MCLLPKEFWQILPTSPESLINPFHRYCLHSPTIFDKLCWLDLSKWDQQDPSTNAHLYSTLIINDSMTKATLRPNFPVWTLEKPPPNYKSWRWIQNLKKHNDYSGHFGGSEIRGNGYKGNQLPYQMIYWVIIWSKHLSRILLRYWTDIS